MADVEELDRVVLVRDLPEKKLKAGDVATVVLVYQNGEGFEVEFMTLDGETFALETVHADALRAVRAQEIAHARDVA